jgi:uroporphyrinogen decarboxylase
MSRREEFFSTILRKGGTKIPFYLKLCESLKQEYRTRIGVEDLDDYFGIPFRVIHPHATKNPVDYKAFAKYSEEPDFIDDLGVGHIRGSVHHFTKFVHPMEHFETPEQVWEFPLPDLFSDYRWVGFSEKVNALKEQDYITISGNIDVYEPAWYLRGMDNLLMDMVADPDMAASCLDRMAGFKNEYARKLAEVGIDVIIYGDDVGAEHSMIMSPELWREWLKPRLKKSIESAKSVNPDVLVYYHSDGYILPIIDDLIEIGVDILNPIQPECMDPVEIKEKFGSRVSFWGTIGTQTTMPFGTPEDVRAAVKEMAEKVGKGGGLVLAPTHLLEPEVPIENIDEFVRASKEYGGWNF